MQTITTKYHGPGNVRGARISAKTTSGIKISLSWDYSLDADGNHQRAARALALKLNWRGQWVSGTLAGGAVVWVPVFHGEPVTFD